MAIRRRVSRYIAVWPGDDSVSPCYDGQPITLPPRNVIADPKAPGSKYRFGPARDHDGKAIPGTVLLETDIRPNPQTGGVRTEFDAEAWVDGLLGVNGMTGTGAALQRRGFTVVDDADDVPAAMRAGRPMWEGVERDRCFAILDEEAARRKSFADKNQRYVAGPHEAKFRAAHATLLAMNAQAEGAAISDDELLSVRGMPSQARREVVFPPAASVSPVVAALESPLQIQADKLFDECERKGVYLTRPDLAGLVKLDPVVIKSIEAKLAAKLEEKLLEKTKGPDLVRQ